MIYNNKMNSLRKIWSKTLFWSFAFIFLYAAPVAVFAQATATTCLPSSGKICPPIQYTSINGFIKGLLEGVLKIGIPVVALAIIYSGFLFVSALGNSEKLTKAKEALLYTIIGAAILIGAWSIAQLISNTVLAL